ncbi:MAG: class I SAM-dependent methyltransferase [Nitriliruptoraceae bacterium]
MELDERTLQAVAAYDDHASDHQSAHRLRRPLADIRRFADMAERDDLVLDVACGPASDLRLLRDTGVHPVGIDLSSGALDVARMLLPRHPLVQAPLHDPPFVDRSFRGLWMSGSFTHLPRSQWQETFARLLRLLEHGPVYLSCLRGTHDMEPSDDPVLGAVHVSEAVEPEIAEMFAARGLVDVTVEVRPDPILDRRRLWVVALGRLPRRG